MAVFWWQLADKALEHIELFVEQLYLLFTRSPVVAGRQKDALDKGVLCVQTAKDVFHTGHSQFHDKMIELECQPPISRARTTTEAALFAGWPQKTTISAIFKNDVTLGNFLQIFVKKTFCCLIFNDILYRSDWQSVIAEKRFGSQKKTLFTHELR